MNDITELGGWNKLISSLRGMSDKTVSVGFVSGTKYENGQDVVDVAAKNEFGDSKAPPRPFMKNAIDNGGKYLKSITAENLSQTLQGKLTSEALLEEIGKAGVKMIQMSIDEGNYIPNSPYTIAKKGSDHPLIDTGLMRSSVTYRISEKKK